MLNTIQHTEQLATVFLVSYVRGCLALQLVSPSGCPASGPAPAAPDYLGTLFRRVGGLERRYGQAQAGTVRAPRGDGDGQADHAGGGFFILEGEALLADFPQLGLQFRARPQGFGVRTGSSASSGNISSMSCTFSRAISALPTAQRDTGILSPMLEVSRTAGCPSYRAR